MPEALLPYSHPDFAISSQFLPIHHTFPAPCPRFFQRTLLTAIFEMSCVLYSRCHTPGAVPSTGSPFAIQKYSFQRFPCRHRLAPLSRCIYILFLGISLPLWYFFLDCFPKFIRYCPRLIALSLFYFVSPSITLYHFSLYLGIGSKFLSHHIQIIFKFSGNCCIVI